MIKLRRPGWFGKHLKENIRELQNGNYRSIPWIFCTLIEDHHSSKLIAAEALNNILNSLEFDDIIRIDAQMRQMTSMEWSIDWRKLSINQLLTSDMNPDLRRAVIIFASFNPNGFIREQAVQMMGDLNNTLSFVILRQNDWVEQVRNAAEQSFNTRMMRFAPNELMEALPFAEKIKRCKHGYSMQTFYDYLTDPNQREDLVAGLQSPQIKTRRIYINAIMESAHSDMDLLREHLNHESDPYFRKVIFEYICTHGENAYELAQKFLKDKYPPNRVYALKYLYVHNRPMDQTIKSIAIEYLLDKNAFVRALARKVIIEFEKEFDFSAYYRDHLEDATVPAILGLGETGQSSDCTKLEIYLHSSQSNIVSAAIDSLMQLNGKQYSEKVIDLLDHPSASVVKTAHRLIRIYGIEDYTHIQSIFDSTAYIHSKIKCALLLFAAPKWQSIFYSLHTLSDENAQVQLLSTQAINQWLFSYNQSFDQATTQQKENIKQLITEVQGRLTASVVRELMFVLR